MVIAVSAIPETDSFLDLGPARWPGLCAGWGLSCPWGTGVLAESPGNTCWLPSGEPGPRAWVSSKASSSSATESCSSREAPLAFWSGALLWGRRGSLSSLGVAHLAPRLRGGWKAFCAAGETKVQMGLTGGGKGSRLRKSKALLFLQVFGSSLSLSPSQDFDAIWAAWARGADFSFGVQCDKGLG